MTPPAANPPPEMLQVLKDVRKSMSTFNVQGGSHSTSNDAILEITQLIGLQQDQIVWDIGVGTPIMALFFSMITKKPVIGTDIGKLRFTCICSMD